MHSKNKDFDKPEFTFCPRRVTSNPSRIKYILVSDNLVNKASNIKVEIRPHTDINSDHDYMQFDMYFGKR